MRIQPDDLKQAALGVAGQHTAKISWMLRFNQPSQEILIELFDHPDKSLVGQLAVEEWQRKERGAEADNIRPLWERAIIEYCEDDFWLGEIFSVETELGLKWLVYRLGDESFMPFQYKRSISSVLERLNLEDRQKLLVIVPNGDFHTTIISSIIGNNPTLYKLLLQQSWRNTSALLSPLYRSIDSVWIAFATLASQQGFAAKQIVGGTFARIGHTTIWSGNYSNIWNDWIGQFKTIMNHEDETIRHIAEVGFQMSSNQYKEELKKEHDEEVYGRD